MTADVLTLPTRATPTPSRRADFDPGYAAFALLTRLRDALAASAPLVAECRKQHARRSGRWGVPPLHFFHHPARTEPTGPTFPEPYLSQLTPKLPAAAEAWYALPDLFDDALTLLPAVVAVRRTARAIDGLNDRAGDLADVLPAAKELCELLAVPDDQVVLAVHPSARVGVRVVLRGVADVNQLHVLLADALPGPPPDPRAVDACRDARPDPTVVFTPRHQLFHPSALRPDGTLPAGFRGSDQWVWGHQCPSLLPLEKGERVVLLGHPAYRGGWEAGRKFLRMRGELEVVERLSAADVTRWLANRCPQLPTLADRLAA
jgi:hypothetical protein